MNLSLLILAAGMGSRYGGLKQLDPVGPNGESLLEYCVYDSRAAGFNKAVLIIRRDFEKEFRQKIGKRIEAMLDVDYVYQELDELPANLQPKIERKKPWGTAHAIWCARNKINNPFAVINADDFYGYDAFRAIAKFLPEASEGLYAMVGYRLANTLSEHGSVARGVCQVDKDNFLVSVCETFEIKRNQAGQICADKQLLADDQLVSMNLWGFCPPIFQQIEERLADFLKHPQLCATSEFYIPRVVEDLIASKRVRVKVLSTSAQWFGLTYKEDRESARTAIERMIERAELPKGLV